MFFSVNVVLALILALSQIDGAVSDALVTVSPDLPRICPRTTRTTTSRTTIIAPACPTVTVKNPGFIGCPILVCADHVCPLDAKAPTVTVPVGCPTRCCPKKTPTVTAQPTCSGCGCPGPVTAYSVQKCPI